MQGKRGVGAWGIIPTFNLEGARAHPRAHGNFPISLPQNSLDFCGAERWGDKKMRIMNLREKLFWAAKCLKSQTLQILFPNLGETHIRPLISLPVQTA